MKIKTFFVTIPSLLLFVSQTVHAVDLNQFYLPGSDLTTAGSGSILSRFLQPIVSNLPIFTGIAALFFTLFAGFRFIASAGNAEETQKASNMLTYSLVGLGLSVLAYWITRIIFQVAGIGDLF